MDAARFDALTSRLTSRISRRRSLGLLALLSLPGLIAPAWSDAKNKSKSKKKKPCPPCKKRKKGKCKGTLSDGSACAGGTCQGGSCLAAPLPPTCTDGIKNGAETDVDCGGSCPPCGQGQTCAAPTDCANHFCTNSTCQVCPEPANPCGADSVGPCICAHEVDPQSLQPFRTSCFGTDVIALAGFPYCSDGRIFVNWGGPNDFQCARPCGEPA